MFRPVMTAVEQQRARARGHHLHERAAIHAGWDRLRDHLAGICQGIFMNNFLMFFIGHGTLQPFTEELRRHELR